MNLADQLRKMHACPEAIEWVGDRTAEQAWKDCPRGDWMLWWYAKTYPERKREIALAKGHCVNTVRHLMKDKRSIEAVDVVIAYGEGRATEEELAAASAASAAASADADAAASAAAASAAYAAADAAAYAAYAAYAAAADAAAAACASDAAASAADAYADAYASDAAASAAAAYAAAASAAAAADARKKNQKLTANICRKYLNIGEETE